MSEDSEALGGARLGVSKSCDKDDGYTTPSAVIENPMLHANITALCFIERKL